MSTVVGIQGDDWCVIGADSQVSENGRVYSSVRGTGKIVKRGPYFIATVGDFRPATILNYNLSLPKPPTKTTSYNLDKFVSTKIIPAIQASYTENNYTPTDKESGSDFLIAVCGQLYAISSDFSWTKDRRGYYAFGSGGDYALGAMATYQQPKSITKATLIARTALAVACEYDTESGEPLIIYSQQA